MQEHELITLAAPPTLAVVHGIREDRMTAPTPCREFTVGDLIDHLLHWGPPLARASRHSDGVPQPGGNPLERQIEMLVAAWSVPAAWQGTTSITGTEEFPARMIGMMAVTELVVHGWDLARATGQPASWDPELLALLHDEVAKTAQLGREMGAFGAEVPVPRTAPVLDRLLGLTGRDPQWTPVV